MMLLPWLGRMGLGGCEFVVAECGSVEAGACGWGYPEAVVVVGQVFSLWLNARKAVTLG